ncbi:hypothetical protein QFZ77_005214 [Paenibacillus sp. V4I3]|nr:hypothetical protein [Paenibacillus sp. V4I3]
MIEPKRVLLNKRCFKMIKLLQSDFHWYILLLNHQKKLIKQSGENNENHNPNT